MQYRVLGPLQVDDEGRALGQDHATAVEASLRRAVDIAVVQGTVVFRRRAEASLARLVATVPT